MHNVGTLAETPSRPGVYAGHADGYAFFEQQVNVAIRRGKDWIIDPDGDDGDARLHMVALLQAERPNGRGARLPHQAKRSLCDRGGARSMSDDAQNSGLRSR